jgi:hypothetical protein
MPQESGPWFVATLHTQALRPLLADSRAAVFVRVRVCVCVCVCVCVAPLGRVGVGAFTLAASQTLSTGMPAMGLLGSSSASLLTVSEAPITSTTSVVLKSSLISSIFRTSEGEGAPSRSRNRRTRTHEKESFIERIPLPPPLSHPSPPMSTRRAWACVKASGGPLIMDG